MYVTRRRRSERGVDINVGFFPTGVGTVQLPRTTWLVSFAGWSEGKMMATTYPQTKSSGTLGVQRWQEALGKEKKMDSRREAKVSFGSQRMNELSESENSW